MQSGWRIGSLFGIPLLVNFSWFLILAFVTLGYSLFWQGQGWTGSITWGAGLAMALLLFGSVLLHELGHSLIARSQGIKVSSITLFLFGGIAAIDQESKTPSQAFQVAIAGPAVSFSLFILLTLAYYGLPRDLLISAIIRHLAGINLVLSLFNMLPGLPLDGGQVLKAAIWKFTGSRLQGVRWAARVGQWLGWAAVLLSIVGFLYSFNPTILWMGLLGWFGVRHAVAYSQVTDLQEALLQIRAATAMTHDFRVVDAHLTVHQFTDDYLSLETSQVPAFYAASDGRYRGMLLPEDLRVIERSEWDAKTVQDIVHPLSEVPSVEEPTPLTEVIDMLETQQLRRLTVLSPAGAVSGVIDRGDIVQAIADKLKIPISRTVIKRIKEEGAYPPGLQLQTIAKAARDG
jgi:Zn-dependent protease/CBS domain-containing protein